MTLWPEVILRSVVSRTVKVPMWDLVRAIRPGTTVWIEAAVAVKTLMNRVNPVI